MGSMDVLTHKVACVFRFALLSELRLFGLRRIDLNFDRRYHSLLVETLSSKLGLGLLSG